MLLIKGIGLIILPSLIACFIMRSERKWYIFDISLCAFILSVLETVLGRGDYSLIGDVNHISLSHSWIYAIVLIVVCGLANFFLSLVMKEKASAFLNYSLGIMAFIFLLFIVFWKIDNIALIVILLIGYLGGLILSLINIDDKYRLDGKHDKETFICSLCVSILYGFMMYFFNPNELYLSNYDDMHVHWINYLFGTGVWCVLVIVFLVLLLNLLPRVVTKIASYVLFIIACLCYIQGNFMNGAMMTMDGGYQVWSLGQLQGNLLIWVGLIALFAVLIKLFTTKKLPVHKIVCGVCIYLSLVQLATVTYMYITTDMKQKYVLTTENELTLDDENNTIVFVLDWYDSQIIDLIKETHPDFLAPLNDFTFYDNCSGKYIYTVMGIPYLLTGVDWSYDIWDHYVDYALDNSTLLEDMRDNGYSIGLYTVPECISEKMNGVVSNFTYLSWKDAIDYEKMLDVTYQSSRYKCFPYFLKTKYTYTSYDFEDIYANTQAYNTSSDANFAWDVVDQGITVDTKMDGAYRLYHLNATHPPFSKPDDCEDSAIIYMGMKSLEIVYDYIDKLKEKGLYEDTTIIITADHGQNYLLRTDEQLSAVGFELDRTSSPICFYKAAGKGCEDDVDMAVGPKVSMAPVTQNDIVQTIAESMGLEKEYASPYTLDEVDGNMERERVLIAFPSVDGEDYREYRINGYVKDKNNWRVVEAYE